MDQVSQICGQLFSQGKEETAPESARLAVCQIIHKQSLGLGFLAFNQKLRKYCIITTDKVVLNDRDDYKVQFSRKSRPTKTFNLKEIIKETVKHDISGLVTIFIDRDSSCLLHNKKPCSILTSYLIIANRDEKKQQFCYVGNKRYDLCASGQHGKPCLKHVNNDSNTTTQSTNTSQETLEGSVILQCAGDNASFEAVGILSAKDETWDVIWFNSTILDPADQPDLPGPVDQPDSPGPVDQPDPPGPVDQPDPPGPVDQPDSPGPVDQPDSPGPVDQPDPPGPADQPDPPGPADQPDPPGPVDQPDPPGSTDQPDPPPGNQDLPSLTGIPTQEEREETSYNYKDFLVSEKVYGNKYVQEKLAVGLDRTCHRVIKDWEHLACTKEISAPLEVRLSCKINSENNCTLMLFDVLTAEKEDTLTVQDMINALEAINRPDVKKIITDNKGHAYYTQSFSVFASSRDNSELIFKMANRLNQKSSVNKNWRDLGRHQFHLSEERLDEIELGQSTQILMKYLYTEKTDLTIGMFYDEVEKLNRRDVLKILRKFMCDQGNGERLMKDAIKLDSDDMRDICVTLNKPTPGLKNWRQLASSLGIPENIYKDCEPGKCKSPTDTLFEWIFANKVNLTVGQLIIALDRIDRNDLVNILKDHFKQKNKNSSEQGETA